MKYKAELLLLKLIHLFAREVLLVKKSWKLKKLRPPNSTFKTDIVKVGLFFSVSNFFINKISHANRWMRKKIPTCSNSALVVQDHTG